MLLLDLWINYGRTTLVSLRTSRLPFTDASHASKPKWNDKKETATYYLVTEDNVSCSAIEDN